MMEGQSIGRPPLLDGSNYPYWKSRMRAFLKSVDKKAWKAVVVAWKPPQIITADGTICDKSEDLWTAQEEEEAYGNSKAINAIMAAVDRDNFRIIQPYQIAKQAWDALQTVYEGTDKVRKSRLQMLRSKFEKLRMKEEETISDFSVRLMDLVNEADALDKPYEEKELVDKVLRSLTAKFHVKVTTLEELQDTTDMKLDALIGSLRTYEMKLQEEKPEKQVKTFGL